MQVGGIEIYETYNAGAVTGIYLQTPARVWQCVYNEQPVVIQHSRVFCPALMTTDFSTNRVRLELNCTAANDWCEIDAVKLLPVSTQLSKSRFRHGSPLAPTSGVRTTSSPRTLRTSGASLAPRRLCRFLRHSNLLSLRMDLQWSSLDELSRERREIVVKRIHWENQQKRP